MNDMLAYFDQLHLKLGPLTIQASGVIAALAVIASTAVLRRRAIEEQLEPIKARQLARWMLVSGFIVAHLFDRLVDHPPREALAEPLSIFRVWTNLSAVGGFLGAALGAWLYNRRHPLRAETWRYLDAIAYAFVFGWIVARAGCALAFDHPGQETTWFLGQVYRDELVRHNLGLYEALYFVPLALGFRALGRNRRPPGFFVGLLAVLYGVFRFFADFLGIAELDVRHGGLTSAQWGSLALLIVGGALARWAGRSDPRAPATG
jgi:phosphatidylglycerol:prolipoprotein diacylglycerol transferase